MKTFFFFWSSPPNLRAKSIPKEDNKRFGAKYSPDCRGIPKAHGLGCVNVPPKVFLPPPRNPLRWLQACYCTVPFAVHKLYYGLQPDSQQIIFIYFTKCSHFEEISRKTVFAICKFSAIYQIVIIAFLLKRCCSKSASLKSVLSVQIGKLLATLSIQFWFRKYRTTYDKTRLHICELRQNVKGNLVCSTKITS